MDRPETSQLVLAFINGKSGGQQGAKVKQKLCRLLPDGCVHDLSEGGPEPALRKYEAEKARLLLIACGGDGTVCWVLSALDKLKWSPYPPIAVLPLGTGNDMARALLWGKGYEGEDLSSYLGKLDKSKPINLDRWKVHASFLSASEIKAYRNKFDAAETSDDEIDEEDLAEIIREEPTPTATPKNQTPTTTPTTPTSQTPLRTSKSQPVTPDLDSKATKLSATSKNLPPTEDSDGGMSSFAGGLGLSAFSMSVTSDMRSEVLSPTTGSSKKDKKPATARTHMTYKDTEPTQTLHTINEKTGREHGDSEGSSNLRRKSLDEAEETLITDVKRHSMLDDPPEYSHVEASGAAKSEPVKKDSEPSRNENEKEKEWVMNNYFSLGMDGRICLDFHNFRNKNPELFKSKVINYGWYAGIALKNSLYSKTLNKSLKLKVDGRHVSIKKCATVIISNIPSYSAGADLWGTPKKGKFKSQAVDDNLFEVVGLKGAFHAAQLQGQIAVGVRLAQGKEIELILLNEVEAQIDGEPFKIKPAKILINFHNQAVMMLNKEKDKKGKQLRKLRGLETVDDDDDDGETGGKTETKKTPSRKDNDGVRTSSKSSLKLGSSSSEKS